MTCRIDATPQGEFIITFQHEGLLVSLPPIPPRALMKLSEEITNTIVSAKLMVLGASKDGAQESEKEN